MKKVATVVLALVSSSSLACGGESGTAPVAIAAGAEHGGGCG